MAETMTVKEAAKRWGITERRVTVLCAEGRIEGVHKKGRSWRIPVDAKKPADSRVKTGAYRKSEIQLDLPLLKRRMKILLFISETKRFGPAVKNIGTIRGHTR